ncbi:MAG: hypothetical protein F6K00_26835 [Leptolyngbya sp. SIOISBB]|nr:hypothetical protein [Leptolyngbya sp. SIOISBB]
MSKRINVTLPDTVAELLEKWADHEGRPTANLAAYIIETAVREAESKGKFLSESTDSQEEQKKAE